MLLVLKILQNIFQLLSGKLIYSFIPILKSIFIPSRLKVWLLWQRISREKNDNTYCNDWLFKHSIFTDYCSVGVLAEHWSIVIDICYINIHCYNIT